MASRRAERLQRRNARKDMHESYDIKLALLKEQQEREASKLRRDHKLGWDEIQRHAQLAMEMHIMQRASEEEKEAAKNEFNEDVEKFRACCDIELTDMKELHEAEIKAHELSRKWWVQQFDPRVIAASERAWEYV
jgi:hypothetical protein